MLPRITQLMALAIKLDEMVRAGVLPNSGEVARLGHGSRARVSHILGLLQLAPDIQEELLFAQPRNEGGILHYRAPAARSGAALRLEGTTWFVPAKSPTNKTNGSLNPID